MNLITLLFLYFIGLQKQAIKTKACKCGDGGSSSSIEITHSSTSRKFVLRSQRHNTLLGVDPFGDNETASISAFKPDETLLEEHHQTLPNVFFSTCDPKVDFKRTKVPFSICLGGQMDKKLVYNSKLERFQVRRLHDGHNHPHIHLTEAMILDREDEDHMFPAIYIKLRSFLGSHTPILLVNRHRPGRLKAAVSLKDIRRRKIRDVSKAHLLITDIR